MSLLATMMNRAVSTWNIHEVRKFIADVEEHLQKFDQVDVPITHRFSEGVYSRTMYLKADSLVVGKIHKHRNLNILLSGEVSILSTDGIVRVKAPYQFVAMPGAKRVIYAHTDVSWATIHGTCETDPDKIEEEFIAKSYDEVVPWPG